MTKNLIILCIFVATACHAQPTVYKDELQLTKLVSSTVEIYISCPEGRGSGSGVVIKSQGGVSSILTAAHLLPNVACSLAIGEGKKPAALVKQDKDADLMLLYVVANLPAASIAHSSYLGEDVVTAGFPGSLYDEMTSHLTITKGVMATSFNDGMVRITCDVYFGASGSGVFDKDGHVVGIVSRLLANEDDKGRNIPIPGMYFAVGLDAIQRFLK